MEYSMAGLAADCRLSVTLVNQLFSVFSYFVGCTKIADAYKIIYDIAGRTAW
jgi:hypothetical protein